MAPNFLVAGTGEGAAAACAPMGLPASSVVASFKYAIAIPIDPLLGSGTGAGAAEGTAATVAAAEAATPASPGAGAAAAGLPLAPPPAPAAAAPVPADCDTAAAGVVASLPAATAAASFPVEMAAAPHVSVSDTGAWLGAVADAAAGFVGKTVGCAEVAFPPVTGPQEP